MQFFVTARRLSLCSMLEAAMDAVQTAWDLMIYMALEYPAPTLLEDENEQ